MVGGIVDGEVYGQVVKAGRSRGGSGHNVGGVCHAFEGNDILSCTVGEGCVTDFKVGKEFFSV